MTKVYKNGCTKEALIPETYVRERIAELASKVPMVVLARHMDAYGPPPQVLPGLYDPHTTNWYISLWKANGEWEIAKRRPHK